MNKFTREDFEHAARAAGYIRGETFKFHPACGRAMVRDQVGMQWVIWNPLEDDGDALRLAVKLGLQIAIGNIGVLVMKLGYEDIFEPTGADRHAATRRAIFRAAIAIGKAMQ